MNLAIYNNRKLIFFGDEGCCIIDGVGYKEVAVVYAEGESGKKYNNFLRELIITTGSSFKSKMNYLLDKVEYDSCKKKVFIMMFYLLEKIYIIQLKLTSRFMTD